MKSFILTLLIGFSALFPLKGQEPVSFHLQSLNIQGKTNVSRFTFSFDSSITHQLKLNKNNPTAGRKEEVLFRIPIKAFRSGNKMMRKDFQELLKASQYPHIKVSIEKDKLLDILQGIYLSDLELNISLAGQTQAVQSQYDIQYQSTDRMLLEGLTNLKLKQFNLKPPQKMMGLVQVKNSILINFDIVLTQQKTALNQ
ncbi:MAG TPA: hypothetical protein VJ876_06510 [Bacteroidales bacterium]|nr:hypothetical protein [Bacteroidales bacterium]